MTPAELDQTTIDALAGSDLSNLADGIAREQLPEEKPAAAAAKARGVAVPPPVSNARPECRPVAVGGMFAALHPECNQDYLERFQQLRTQLMLHRSRVAPAVDFHAVAVMSTRKGEGKSFTATNLASILALLRPRECC
jgi:Mrp family chromosome partitioning ATPase